MRRLLFLLFFLLFLLLLLVVEILLLAFQYTGTTYLIAYMSINTCIMVFLGILVFLEVLRMRRVQKTTLKYIWWFSILLSIIMSVVSLVMNNLCIQYYHSTTLRAAAPADKDRPEYARLFVISIINISAIVCILATMVYLGYTSARRSSSRVSNLNRIFTEAEEERKWFLILAVGALTVYDSYACALAVPGYIRAKCQLCEFVTPETDN